MSKRTYHKISEDHLWFSIFSRPVANKFTRVQRCTCCFVLFFISMFLNIMYYDLSTEAKTTNSTSASLSLGPLHIGTQQVVDWFSSSDSHREYLDNHWYYRRVIGFDSKSFTSSDISPFKTPSNSSFTIVSRIAPNQS